ncbi:MAG: PadR family transcriptional regulator [Methanimicrococcus sp.]|nr:PadR family transcriptional regulator [Methanimicrococcus sp.]
MEKTEWLSQVKRGILEYSTMLLIKNKSIYGYELIASLNKHDILSTSEGTLYPLLKRIEKENLITATWKETAPGTPPRKYYDLTEDGHLFLDMMNHEWNNLVSAISQIKNEKEIDSNE